MRVLAVNTGSTSVKVSVLGLTESAPDHVMDIARMSVSGVGGPRPRASGMVLATTPTSVAEAAQQAVAAALVDHADVEAVLHRVVHGGGRPGPARVSDALISDLAALAPLAPLHQPIALATIAATSAAAPGKAQVACFDTSFFADLPETATRLLIDTTDPVVRRYGFHGLAYDDVIHQLGPALGERTILAHVGGGVSMTAVRDGRPVDTTMGMTPLGGLPMSTRSGDLDPGVVLYLLRQGHDPAVVEGMLSHRSGLASVADNGDLRSLELMRDTDAGAALAIEMLDRRLLMQAGAYAALLGGLDLIAFSGGSGEHDARLRDAVVDGLHRLGLNPRRDIVHVREDHAMARRSDVVLARM